MEPSKERKYTLFNVQPDYRLSEPRLNILAVFTMVSRYIDKLRRLWIKYYIEVMVTFKLKFS